MTVRAVEWKQPYTWGTAIEIDENKVISLRLRDENNLIIYDAGDNEIYVDLQLPDELTPTDAFPVWITTGRVIVDNGWDLQWTLICAKTTSGDNIKLLYADEWTLWIDNWTWTFKQILFKSDIDTIVATLTTYIDWELAKKQNWVTSATAPTDPAEWDLWYDTTHNTLKVYNWSSWVSTWWGWGGSWDVVVSTDTGNELSTGAGLWFWTESDYSSISTPDTNTLYIQYKSDWGGWQPWVNTLAYYPLESDVKDYSWNNNDGTNNGVTFSNVWGVDCAVFTSASTKIWLPWFWNFTNLTMSAWIKTTASYANSMIVAIAPTSDNKNCSLVVCNWVATLSRYIWTSYNIADWTVNDWAWHHILGTYTSTWWTKLYVDWVYIDADATTTSVSSSSGYTFIWWHQSWQSQFTFSWNISNVILETAERTAQEITDYYNQTKSLYWIS